MRIVKKCTEIQHFSYEARKMNQSIGLVPTMGYFHDGHLSLMKESIKNCDVTVVSMFVNPTQFGPFEDLDKYPKDFERDREHADKVGIDILFAPDNEEIYSKEHDTFIEVKGLSQTLCGVSRPTHFRGVTTIVAKLFNLVKPHRVYFGQKDAQQAIIINKMIKELHYDIDMNIMPTIREHDGLALSSRNKYLSLEERVRALSLSSALNCIEQVFEKGTRAPEELKNAGLKVIEEKIDKEKDKIDYLEIRDAKELSLIKDISQPILVAVAIYIGKTRLIDNIILNNKKNGV